jgi:hypothetical protein
MEHNLFTGFFATVDPAEIDEVTEIINDAEKQWTTCRGKVVYDPYIGLAIAPPGFWNTTAEDYQRALDAADRVEKELATYVRTAPSTGGSLVRMQLLGCWLIWE